MSKMSGFVLIVAGLGAAAYVTPWAPGRDAEKHLIDVVKITTNGENTASVREPLPAPVIAPTAKPATRPAADEAAPSRPATTVASAAERALPSTSSAVIVPAPAAPQPRAGVLAPASSATVLSSTSRDDTASLTAGRKSRTADSEARSTLASDIQRELKRVGCYEGDVNGDWGSATRKAMKSFTERVNATLPVDEPDYILLTLVQGQSTPACGKSCPAGQSIASDGRCLPTAVIAQAQRRAVPKPAAAQEKIEKASKPAVTRGTAVASWETEVTPAPRAELPSGRMAIGAPATSTLEPTAKPSVGASEQASDKSKPKVRVAAVNPKADEDDEEKSAAKAKPTPPSVPKAAKAEDEDEKPKVRSAPAPRPVPALRRPSPAIVYVAPPRPAPVRIYGSISTARASAFNTQNLFARLARDGR